jgi:hypothetical protein
VGRKERGLFEHVAFVTVVANKQVRARIPVALVDDRTVVIPVSIEDDDSLQLVVRRELWVGQVYDSLLVLADQFKQLEALVGDKKREDAIERARAIMDGLREDLAHLNQAREGLVADAKDVKDFKLDLTDGDQRMNDLRSGQGKLQDFIIRIDQVIKEEKDPKRAELKDKAARAELLENEAEFGKALDLYKEVIDGKVADQKLIDHYNELSEAWKEKGEKHAAARKYIYETWATLDPLKVKDNLNAARAAFEECKKAGDKLSPQRLRKVAIAHSARLLEKTKQLDNSREEDRDLAKQIVEVAEGLTKLVQDINAFVEK